MLKTMFLATILLTGGFSAAQANEAVSCLAKYGTILIPEAAKTVSPVCRKFLFPPQPGKVLFTLGGNEIREVALRGLKMYGYTQHSLPAEKEYRPFWWPKKPGENGFTFTAPDKERGGLY